MDEFRPANAALQIIEEAGDARFTTEIALFNLEINFAPLPIAPTLLADFSGRLADALVAARAAAEHAGKAC